MEDFEGRIFTGNMADIGRLYMFLQTALDHINVLDQGGFTTLQESELIEEGIRDNARQIYLALTGIKIKAVAKPKVRHGKTTREAKAASGQTEVSALVRPSRDSGDGQDGAAGTQEGSEAASTD